MIKIFIALLLSFFAGVILGKYDICKTFMTAIEKSDEKGYYIQYYQGTAEVSDTSQYYDVPLNIFDKLRILILTGLWVR